MTTVKLSPKFQVVIPKEMRERMKLRAGQRLQVVEYEGRLELVPLVPMRKYRGFLKGMPSEIDRGEDRL